MNTKGKDLENADIAAQLELERNMVQRGVDIFENNERTAEDNGRGSDTTYARKMIADSIMPVIDGMSDLIDKKAPGRPNRAKVLLKGFCPQKAAYLTLQVLFNSFTFDAPLTGTAVKIGQRIEDEIRFTRFGELHGDYYRAIQDDFKRKGTRDYQHKHKVLTHKANQFADEWEVSTAE